MKAQAAGGFKDCDKSHIHHHKKHFMAVYVLLKPKLQGS